MWKTLMWLAVLGTIGSCVTLPQVGWVGWFGVLLLWKLADTVEKQEARIEELEARHEPHEDYGADFEDVASPRTTRVDEEVSSAEQRPSSCSCCRRLLTAGDRFCPTCGAAQPDPKLLHSAEDATAIERVMPNSVIDHPEFGRCTVVGVDWETMQGQELKFVTLRVMRTARLERIGMLALANSGARVV